MRGLVATGVRPLMPETPDFDQIAERLARDVGAIYEPSAIVEQLRLVWNARGAADIVKLDVELSTMMGSQAAGPYVKNLDRALRSLDR
jgi:hypothetical protein